MRKGRGEEERGEEERGEVRRGQRARVRDGHSLFTANTDALQASFHDVIIFASPMEDPDISRRLKAEEIGLPSAIELLTEF